MYETLAKQRQIEGAKEGGTTAGRGRAKAEKPSALSGRKAIGESRDDAAAVFEVGKNAVQQAKALLIHASDGRSHLRKFRR